MTKSTSATVVKARAMKHPVDEILPLPKLAVYGFQHVLAFYAGAVIVPILLANSIGLTTSVALTDAKCGSSRMAPSSDKK